MDRRDEGGRLEPTGLRTALHGLTNRGRSFLAAGITAVLCAYVLGQAALLPVGLLLAVPPLAAVLMLARPRYRVSSGRQLTPSHTSTGAEARVQLRVDNVSRVPTGVLMLEDRIPSTLGPRPRPRFAMDRLEPGGFRQVSYQVGSDLRGRFPLGPLQVRLSDPFGMCELTRSFTATDTLTVTPRVHALPDLGLAVGRAALGDGHYRAVAHPGEDDVVPRAYQHGDDLRRVHWRSTAKYGELMVRREEQPEQLRSHATVLLDTRACGHRGSGPASSFEWAVSAAASVATHLLERGFSVRLLHDTGGGCGASGGAAGLLLDSLAVVQLCDGIGFSRAAEVLRPGGEGLLVAVLGSLADEQLAELGRLRGRVGTAVAIVLDPPAWGRGSGAEPAGGEASVQRRLRLLRAGGWRVVGARFGDELPELWRSLSRTGAGSGSAEFIGRPPIVPASSLTGPVPGAVPGKPPRSNG